MSPRPDSLPSLEERQVEGLDRGQLAALANIPTAAVAALILRDSAPFSLLTAWLCLVGLAVAIRFGLTIALVRQKVATRTRLRGHVVGGALSGLAWGVAPVYLVFFGSSSTSTEHIFIACIITGASAAALPSQCWYKPVYLAYLLSATLPLSVAFFFHDDETHTAIAALVLLMIFVLLMTARQYGRTILSTLFLQNDVDALGRRLAAAKDELALADRNKWQTLAHLSHELRTPMNAVLGFSEALSLELYGPLGNPKYQEYTRDIHDSGAHAMSMINEILELSQAQTGTLSISTAPLQLQKLVAESVESVRLAAETKGIKLHSDLPADLPAVRGDHRKLRQVLNNVLGNAIQFTPAGGNVSVHLEPRDETAVSISIADEGVGMSADEIAQALEPFGRLADPLVRSYTGTGLGLPLAKLLTEMHGGTLSVDSTPGSGTTVTLSLPCIVSPSASEPATQSYAA